MGTDSHTNKCMTSVMKEEEDGLLAHRTQENGHRQAHMSSLDMGLASPLPSSVQASVSHTIFWVVTTMYLS